jgi:arylsulfatase
MVLKMMEHSLKVILSSFLISFIFYLVCTSAGCYNQSDNTPNIVIIFIDDLGYADVGCYGAKDFETPQIDQIAAQGMRFTNFYVSQAVCSASRASLLTGCYAERIGIQGALNPWAEHGINPEEETIAELLKKRGYASGIFGKWHLGHHKEFLPLQHGFDEYFGLPYSNDMWPVGFDGQPLNQKDDKYKSRKKFYPPLPLFDGNEIVEEIQSLTGQDQLTARYTERAVQFIESNKNRPFFLYVPHTMVHVPLGVSDRFRGKSRQGMYGDVMMEIDWSVGEILKTLQKYNLHDNTLVIFTSDNGPFPAGSECNQIAATIDFLPTIAAISGAPLPKNPIDGVNILPLMQGVEGANPRDHYFFYYGAELCAVRLDNWKLIFPHEYRSYAGVEPGNDGFPGPYAKEKSGIELYDLENDIGETTNVASQFPDVVEKLTSLAQQAREELGDRLTSQKGSKVRPPGRRGIIDQKEIRHQAVGKGIKLNLPYNRKYSGGGDEALIDGIRGSTNYGDGAWQGFEGNDLDVVIDLGNLLSVDRISCSFLESQFAWIFFPKTVEISISEDGSNFEVIKKFQNKEAQFNPKAVVKNYDVVPPRIPLRYVRVKAENITACPDWHPGAGGKAWIFVDEIVIK